VLYPDSATTIGDLMRNVDTAAYNAKKQGRDIYQFYSEQLSAEVQRRLEIETGLRRALENGELSLNYQAKVDMGSRTITGAEALLRWTSPELGQVTPDEFIPVAEETGLIVSIGEWILDTACKEAAGWNKLVADPVHVGVNLSSIQFLQGDLIKSVESALAHSGLPASLLDLELTESILVANPEETIETLDRLKTAGASVSIDDFGTGYSSLSYLKRLPVDELKIDKAFVLNMTEDKDDEVIVRSTIDLAHNLGLMVVAEGVESAEHVERLKALGCDLGQGYYFAKPIPITEFTTWLANSPWGPE
jgi:EAL domain-containing protein (putative c-di-GMP-specific phosphodiesterase class I)